MRTSTIIITFAIAIILGVSTRYLAKSEDLHHHTGASPEVDKFYSTWKKPLLRNPATGERTTACCGRTDCYEAKIQKRDGIWQVLQRETKTWRNIPENLFEHNQPDPRESPDSKNHICMQPAAQNPIIHCVVLGSEG